MGIWGRASISAGANTSGMDAEFCSSGVVVAAVVAPADTVMAVVSDTWEVVFVIAAVTDCSCVDVVVVMIINGAVVASLDTDTDGGLSTVFSVVVAAVIEVVVCFPEGAAAAAAAGGIVTLTPSAGVEEITSTVFASSVVVTLEDNVAGEAVQVVAGAAAEQTTTSVTDVDSGLVVVTIIFSWAEEAGAVFTAAVATVVRGADVAGVEGVVWVSVGDKLELSSAFFCAAVVVIVESEGFAWAVFIAVVAVEDAEVGFDVAEAGLGKLGTGVEITVDEEDVAGGVRACGQSFAALVVVSVFAVVVTAGVTLTVSDTVVVAVVIVVAGANVRTALTGMVGGAVGVAATGAATHTAQSGPVAFTLVQVEVFVSTSAVEATSVGGFESGRGGDMVVLAAGGGVVVVRVPVTGTLVEEDAEETWVDAVSELGTAAGGEQTTWAEGDVEAAKGRGVVTWGAGVAGTGTEAEAAVEA